MKRSKKAASAPHSPDLFSFLRPLQETSPSETVSFRLSPELSSILAQRAEVHGLSYHQYAKALLVESLLRSAKDTDLVSALAKFHGQSEAIQTNLAFFMKTFAMTIAKKTAEEADEWLKRNFRR